MTPAAQSEQADTLEEETLSPYKTPWDPKDIKVQARGMVRGARW